MGSIIILMIVIGSALVGLYIAKCYTEYTEAEEELQEIREREEVKRMFSNYLLDGDMSWKRFRMIYTMNNGAEIRSPWYDESFVARIWNDLMANEVCIYDDLNGNRIFNRQQILCISAEKWFE